MRTVKVSLGERSYPILIGTNLLRTLGGECAKLKLGKRCALITDAQVAPLYAKKAMTSLRGGGFEPILITIPSGEKSKSFQVAQKCCDELSRHRLERKSFVVALGGGVVGDLAGFVASIYLRGVDFVQVPTTLLAQVDSSVGGKVGINLPAGKNLVGSFYQPRLVLCDLSSLRSLPEREYRSGLAEVIKYGIIRDGALFNKLEKNLGALLRRNPAFLTEVVARCCEIKAEVVGKDEKEGGLRAILNFGHTIGHAIEAVSGYGTYLHGEAISIGQIAAAKLSAALTGLKSSDSARVEKLFKRAALPVSIKLSAAQKRRLFNAMRLDKKVLGGEVKFVLATRLGKVECGKAVPPALIEQVLQAD